MVVTNEWLYDTEFNFLVTGALFGGLLAAGAVLERNSLIDLVKLHKSIGRQSKSKKKVE